MRRPSAPLWRDVGRIDTFRVEEGWGWTVSAYIGPADDYSESYDLPGTYPTEGAAIDAAKKWADQRGLKTTWASLTLRQRTPDPAEGEKP